MTSSRRGNIEKFARLTQLQIVLQADQAACAHAVAAELVDVFTAAATRGNLKETKHDLLMGDVEQETCTTNFWLTKLTKWKLKIILLKMVDKKQICSQNGNLECTAKPVLTTTCQWPPFVCSTLNF